MTRLAAVEKTPVSLQELSYGCVSTSYAEQLIARLRIAGLVNSVRGPGGGYLPAEENLTVADVIRRLGPQGFLAAPDVLQALDTVPLSRLQDSQSI
ncbi:Rrf2 family transcriptional regulator [Citrobacter portucalensis]|uniref:Rrf2 family transcriptional regulator n=1 Tax=Citrobacter portucalensis TaxID=1639133 RepID=UPI00226B5C12|nr:Rrf2 family transcriptional regulator [Citrobacter portucalensis]MCX9039771.1 Rrf2 family transcriptional regulator [Citrobacter portucalensis]